MLHALESELFFMLTSDRSTIGRLHNNLRIQMFIEENSSFFQQYGHTIVPFSSFSVHDSSFERTFQMSFEQ
jgi:hypothetical protein